MKKVLFAVAIVSATFVACNSADSDKDKKDTTVVTPAPAPVVNDTVKTIVNDTMKPVVKDTMVPKK